MASLLFGRYFFHLLKAGKAKLYTYQVASLTAQEVAAALRPFYFAVHPDLFWQYPEEKEVNENSLKQLNAYLENLLDNRKAQPTSVTFYLRDTKTKQNICVPQDVAPFRTVNIQLLEKDLRTTVHNILSVCQLSTEYVDQITSTKNLSSTNVLNSSYTSSKMSSQSSEFQQSQYAYNPDLEFTWEWNASNVSAEEIQQKISKEPEIDLRKWLHDNIAKAQARLQACQPIREETEKLCNELKQTLHLEDIIWDCGWGVSHFRGCLQSFRGLTIQHPQDMCVLKGRTVIFGRQTGVSFDGHVIFSSEDVRHNWLDLIKSVEHYDILLEQLPSAEKALSDVLRGVVIDHRKFQPTVMIQKYVQQLVKLTAALYKYKWQHGYPSSWPRRLDHFQLVVECEAGPLMLSPTGQFIVPASCPAFLLVDFLSKNMGEACTYMENYKRMKILESDIYSQCMSLLGLTSLEKDDNVTPDVMVQCCKRLLEDTLLWGKYFKDCRVRVSHYYSVLQDGEICIPWDWKKAQS